jgi:hypothetical protein
MMFLCATCRQAYVISGNAEDIRSLLESPEWQGTFPCVTPHCRGQLKRVKKKFRHLVKGAHSVPLNSFYRAINGFGLYEGNPSSLKDTIKALVGSKVVSVKGFDVGQPERTIIKEIGLEDGTKLHLDSSSRGACVYFIEKGTPSCLEVFERELNEGDDGLAAEDREEAGRAPEAEDGVLSSPEPGDDPPNERYGAELSSVQEACSVREDDVG